MVNKSSPFQTSFFYLMFRNLKKIRENLFEKKIWKFLFEKNSGNFDTSCFKVFHHFSQKIL